MIFFNLLVLTSITTQQVAPTTPEIISNRNATQVNDPRAVAPTISPIRGYKYYNRMVKHVNTIYYNDVNYLKDLLSDYMIHDSKRLLRFLEFKDFASFKKSFDIKDDEDLYGLLNYLDITFNGW